MRTFTIHLLGVIRYLRPDRNPLRRPIDRLHVRLTVALAVLFLVLTPVAVALTARLADHAGLRAEREQANARRSVNATVLVASPSVSRTGFGENTRIGWRDTAGRDHTAIVPAATNEHPGSHRTIWVDRSSGQLTMHPRRHAQTVADSVMAGLTTLTLLALAHSAARAIVDRRLDRRRLALWEREWAAVAPRWTGLP
jgi:hypothetical protein